MGRVPVFLNMASRHVEHLHRQFGQMRVVADTGDRILATCDGGLTFRAHGRDLFLQHASRQRVGGTAGGFDLLEQAPGCFRDPVGQRLDPAGAGGRIGDSEQVGLLEQNQLHVESLQSIGLS